MTRPDVLISGDDDRDASRQLPGWLRRGVPALVLVLLLGALVVRLAHDERRHEVALQAADEVDAVVRLNELGLGGAGSVVVGVQVSGRGAGVRVDPPGLSPADAAQVEVVGAPTVVDAGSGSQLRMRLQPDCGQARSLVRLEVHVPITPASGKRHVLRLPFPEGPDMVRRACGYLPADEALTTMTSGGRLVAGRQLQVFATLRNDGRDGLTVTGIRSPGLAADAELPVQVLNGVPSSSLTMTLRVTDCAAIARDALRTDPVLLQVANGSGVLAEVALPFDARLAATYNAWVRQACP